MIDRIKVIGFDADDTLWINEPYFRETEQKFYALLKEYTDPKIADQELFKTEVDNLELYGYGAKGFALSMIETALRVSKNQIQQQAISEIIGLVRALLNQPVVLLEGVKDVLKFFSEKHYRLIVVTKGDLLDQERKLAKSELADYFHHIEIMSEKKPEDYQKLLHHLDIKAGEFLMIGNSLKSDIMPVVELGGQAIHIPCDTTWQYEHVDKAELEDKHFTTVDTIRDIIPLFSNEKNHR